MTYVGDVGTEIAPETADAPELAARLDDLLHRTCHLARALTGAEQAARRLRDGTASSTSPRSTPCCPGSGWDLYAASKAAVEQATLVAARELGRSGITINTVSPSCPR